MLRKILLKIVSILQSLSATSRYEVQLFNIESKILQSKLIIHKHNERFEGEEIFFTVDDETENQHLIPVLNRAKSFRNGFRSAGLAIARTYAIPAIHFEDDDVIIDVGANLGNLKLYFDYTINKKVRYFAIEPGKLEHYCLVENLKHDPFTKVCNSALGKFDGIHTFSYAPDSGDSSLGKIDNARFSYNVKLNTLETLVSEWGLNETKIRVLKMDAEGYELEVLEGAQPVLSKIDYIAADLSFERGVEQRSTAPEVIHFLLANGFVIENIGLPDSLRFLFRREGVIPSNNDFVFSH